MREALARRGWEAAGASLIGIAGAAMLALVTWSATDPSFNNAVDGEARNLLGRPGAFAGDMLMQTFGLASLVLFVPLAIWGWRLMLGRSLDREKMRFAAWTLALVAA